MGTLLSLLIASAAIGQSAAPVRIELTKPLGDSPKVFSRGWTFSARAIGPKRVDLSKSIQWSGSGSFRPATGSRSQPSFSRHGRNTITLSVNYAGKRYTKTFTVQTVDPDGYAREGSIAHCLSDSHGCPSCPHNVSGPVHVGSPDVLIDGMPAARKGDIGRHASCCGPNTFTIVEGDPDVLIRGKQAARLGARTEHCGGVGKITAAKTIAPAAEAGSGWVFRGVVRFDPPPRSDYDHMGFTLTVAPGSAKASWFRPDQPSIRTSLSMTWTEPPKTLAPGKTFSVTFTPANAGSTTGASGFLNADTGLYFAEKDGADWIFKGQGKTAYAALGEPMTSHTVSFTAPPGRKGNILAFQVVVGTSILGGIGHNYVYEFKG